MPKIKIADRRLESEWYGPGPDTAPTLVFLHEGLGCVALWRDFPARLAAATGYGALVYSRAGYGKSDSIELPRPVRFMHEEALVTLPLVLDEFAIREAILVGHSDGGSIALINAGGISDQRVRGLILEAPHVFVEEVGLESIRAIANQYRNGGLRQRLERYHGANVDAAFWGWNNVWLNPDFSLWNIEEYLSEINVPVLLIQGEDDQYGTIEQVKKIEAGRRQQIRTVLLSNCGHSPHLDQPEQTLGAMRDFLNCGTSFSL